MSLLQPTIGEIIDRMSILKLKIEAYKKTGRKASALITERRELQELMSSFPNAAIFTTPKFVTLENQLYDVNALLWKAEDEVRSVPAQETDRLAVLAKKIPRLNDERMSIVRIIDLMLGCPESEAKVYGAGVEHVVVH